MAISKAPLTTTVSGTEMSRITLGTWGLGGIYYGEVSDEQGIKTVRSFLDTGGNHIDTAFSYHKSEEVIGEAIAAYDRAKLFITSKTYGGCFNIDTLPKIRTDVEISLRDLRTDYLDCYLIHGTPADADHLNKLIDVFAELREEGKIRSIGCSIPGPAVDDASRDKALMAIDTGRLDSIQLTFSIARQKHKVAIEAAAKKNVAVTLRWVLESGMLTGKYPVGHEFAWPDTRNRYLPPQRDGILQIGQDLKAILPEGFSSPREVATAFAMAQPGTTSVLLGANSPEHAVSNCKLTDLPPLPPEFLQKLYADYGARNDEFNPTGEFEHVPSPRKALED